MTNATNFVFLGTPGDDVIDEQFVSLLRGNDILEGDDGNDLLKGFGGQDQIKGEVGNDSLYGGAQRDSLFGGVGDDSLFGGSGNDLIEGGANNDDIFGGSGNDLIYGDNKGPIPPSPSGAFFVEGDDFILAGSGNDTVFGQGGNDFILGGSGRDSIEGGEGNDTITGGAGSDILTGGTGADVFVFDPSTDFKNHYLDVITDFNVNEDRIDLTAFALNINGNDQFAYDDFTNGVTQGLDSAFYQIQGDTYLVARGTLGYNLGELGPDFDTTSGIKIKGVNIDDLGAANFIFPGETPA